MEKLEFADVIPAEPKFLISAMPGIELAVRPPNMRDHVWFCDNYETLLGAQKILADRNWEEICRIVYYLFGEEDRARFPAVTKTFTNDRGVQEKRTYFGYQVLLAALKGIEEATGMLQALTRAIMASNPIIEEAVNQEIKKKLLEMEEQIGEKSATSSTPNTAGQNETLATSPLGT